MCIHVQYVCVYTDTHLSPFVRIRHRGWPDYKVGPLLYNKLDHISMTFSRAVSDTLLQHPVVVQYTVLMCISYIHVLYGTVRATYVQL